MNVLQIILSFLGVVIVAAISGLGAWAIAKRKTSGSPKTTEAETLWAQSEKMRLELRADLSDLRGRLEREQEERIKVTENCQGIREDLLAAKIRIADQSEEIVRLREELQRTREVAASLKDQVDRLHLTSTGVRDDVAVVKRELQMIQGGASG